MICPRCRKDNFENSARCFFCGTEIGRKGVDEHHSYERSTYWSGEGNVYGEQEDPIDAVVPPFLLEYVETSGAMV